MGGVHVASRARWVKRRSEDDGSDRQSGAPGAVRVHSAVVLQRRHLRHLLVHAWLGNLRANVALISALFFFLTITFMLLFIADFRRSPTIKRAAGSFGIITAIIAWYIALAGILTHENSYFALPVGSLSKH